MNSVPLSVVITLGKPILIKICVIEYVHVSHNE